MMRLAAMLVAVALACPYSPAWAQGGRKPAPKKPAAPAAPAPAPKPAPPAPQDVQFTSRYSTGDSVTESVTYVRGERERYELSDMVLIRQHDRKQTVQISRAANTYLLTPDGDASASDAKPDAPSGIVLLDTTYADTGERKTIFASEARRIKTTITRQPQAGACDKSKQQIETDGWYIDPPKALAAQPPLTQQPSSSPCHDTIQTTSHGDAALLAFPIGYTTTITEEDGKSTVMGMEVTALEVKTLEASLFEVPEGAAAAEDARAFAKAVSDANEARLAAGDPAAGMPPPKTPNQTRIAVPELANKTSNEVDTRALRTQLIATLAESKIDAVPLAAGSQAELTARARSYDCDYLLLAEVVELKSSNPGRLGRMVRSTAGDPNKPVTEAKVNVQLLPVDGSKPRLTTTANGKDGGIGIKTGLRLARVAAQLYLRYASPLGALNAMQMMNLGGMGMLESPAFMQMQAGGLTGSGRGIDRTAGAAMFLMEQAMNTAGDGPQAGPSFDVPLGAALEEAANKTADALKKK